MEMCFHMCIKKYIYDYVHILLEDFGAICEAPFRTVCMRAYVRARVFVCVCVCVCVCLRSCRLTRIYKTYTHAHTHTHTHKKKTKVVYEYVFASIFTRFRKYKHCVTQLYYIQALCDAAILHTSIV